MNTKTMKVRCIKSTGNDFAVNCKYTAYLIDGSYWAVEGFQGYKFPLESSLHGNLAFVSACRTVKFIFEPVMR